ncbi:virion protein [Alishewanella sp. SMS9]|nr:virion protein [Alishewanella sp. SMS9]
MRKTVVALSIAAVMGVGVASLSRDDKAPTAGVRDSRSRGIRNNNPLNIEYNKANNWQGQSGSDGRFVIFIEAFFGIRAAARLLKNYGAKYNLKTVREIVSRWAPASENDVEAYVSSVVKRSGLFPDMYLVEGDYAALIAAMIYHENGQQPYDMAMIKEATAAGFA